MRKKQQQIGRGRINCSRNEQRQRRKEEESGEVGGRESKRGRKAVSERGCPRRSSWLASRTVNCSGNK